MNEINKTHSPQEGNIKFIGMNLEKIVMRTCVILSISLVSTLSVSLAQPSEKSAVTKIVLTSKEVKDANELVLQGAKLTAEQAAALEKTLTHSAADVEPLTRLLGYYFFKADYAGETERQHAIIWLVKNYPESSVLETFYARIFDGAYRQKLIDAWKEQVARHPENLRILWNAGSSMEGVDNAASEKYLSIGNHR